MLYEIILTLLVLLASTTLGSGLSIPTPNFTMECNSTTDCYPQTLSQVINLFGLAVMSLAVLMLAAVLFLTTVFLIVGEMEMMYYTFRDWWEGVDAGDTTSAAAGEGDGNYEDGRWEVQEYWLRNGQLVEVE